MKEDLKNIKDSTVKVIEEKENFKKQKEFFNMKVQEQKLQSGIEELFKLDDSYESAKMLNTNFPEIANIITSLKKEHPKYGEKRIKEMANIHLNYQLSASVFSDSLSIMIDNYFLYERCGFSKLLEQENNLTKLEESIKTSCDAILDESKDTAIKAGTAIVNIVKPYGKVAKGQLEDASKLAKNAVNSGSKKLIKVLKSIEEKTNNKNK